MNLKPLGWSLVLVAALVHSYLIAWDGFQMRPRVTGSQTAFILGVLAPLLVAGLGLGLAFRRQPPK